MRFSDLNNRIKQEVPSAPPAREAWPEKDADAPARTSSPGQKPAKPVLPLDAPLPDFLRELAAVPPVVPPAPEPSPAITPSKRLISRKDQQREEASAVRAAERPFRELDAQAREVYSRGVSLAREFLSQADQPYFEKYERILRLADLNSRTLLENPALLNYTNYSTADDYIYAHSANVAIISQAMGLALGLEASVVSFLGFCAMAHDVGMTDSLELVNKPGRLTDEEFSRVVLHSEAGAEKIDRLLDMDHRLKDRARKVILQAHERIDGSGYPNRLVNEEIDILAQIIGIADVYEAMSHPRPWRQAYHPHLAMKHLIDKEGRGFNSKVVKSIIEVLSIYPPGSMVTLTTGEIASVVRINKGSLTRPGVSVLLGPDFVQVPPRYVDLLEHPLTGIDRIVEESELIARNSKYAGRLELARWWVEW